MFKVYLVQTVTTAQKKSEQHRWVPFNVSLFLCQRMLVYYHFDATEEYHSTPICQNLTEECCFVFEELIF